MQLTHSSSVARADRLSKLRSSLKAMPVFSKTTHKVSSKLIRMEESVRTSATIRSQEELSQSVIVSDDPSES